MPALSADVLVDDDPEVTLLDAYVPSRMEWRPPTDLSTFDRRPPDRVIWIVAETGNSARGIWRVAHYRDQRQFIGRSIDTAIQLHGALGVSQNVSTLRGSKPGRPAERRSGAGTMGDGGMAGRVRRPSHARADRVA